MGRQIWSEDLTWETMEEPEKKQLFVDPVMFKLLHNNVAVQRLCGHLPMPLTNGVEYAFLWQHSLYWSVRCMDCWDDMVAFSMAERAKWDNSSSTI